MVTVVGVTRPSPASSHPGSLTCDTLDAKYKYMYEHKKQDNTLSYILITWHGMEKVVFTSLVGIKKHFEEVSRSGQKELPTFHLLPKFLPFWLHGNICKFGHQFTLL